MNSLPYLALPYEDESPRSIIIRTARNNGFEAVSMLAGRLRAAPSYSLEQNLLGKSELTQKLIFHKPAYTSTIQGAFFQQRRGPTSNSPLIIGQTEIPYKLVRTRGHHICPDCINEKGYFKNILDINVIDVCTIHKKYLVSECAECNAALKWTYSEKHSSCRCEKPIRPSASVTEIFGAEYIQQALQSHNHDFFRKLPEVLKSLRHHEQTSIEERNQTLNEAVKIITEPKKALKAYFHRVESEHPGVPISILAAPFRASDKIDKTITEACDQVISEYEPGYPSKCDNCICSTKFLSITETSRALNLTSITLKKIGNFLPPTSDGNRSKYNLKDICSFMRIFSVPGKSELHLTETESLTFTAPGKPLKDKIQAISDGTLRVLASDQRKGLDGVIVPAFIAKTQMTSEDIKDLLSVSEVAAYLNVYKDAVRSISKTKFLSPAVTKGTQPFFDIADVEEFHNKYIFISLLAKAFGRRSNAMVQSLEISGIKPISSPQINNTITYLYLRSDLSKTIGERLDAIEQKIVIGRRKSKIKASKPQISQNSITSREVAAKLNISIRHLTKLETYGLLEKVPSMEPLDTNKRHYSIESFKHAKFWIETAKTIEQFSREIKLNKALFMRRFITNKFASPLFLSRNVGLLSINDQKKIRKHLTKYCTCSEADSYHRAPAKHFQNLIKRGKISKVPSHELPEGFSSDITLLKWSDVKKYRY
jgi:hypothetical protein